MKKAFGCFARRASYSSIIRQRRTSAIRSSMVRINSCRASGASCGVSATADRSSCCQVVDIVAAALGHRWDVISIPYELVACARPLVAQPTNTHRVFDLTKLKTELGDTDLVPAREAFARVPRVGCSSIRPDRADWKNATCKIRSTMPRNTRSPPRGNKRSAPFRTSATRASPATRRHTADRARRRARGIGRPVCFRRVAVVPCTLGGAR